MALSTRLKSQFAKVMNASDVETNTKKTLMGTAVEYGDRIYVQLDGSDQLTPLHDRIAGVKDGDRVTIEIDNHSASLTGNLSDPAAGTTTVAGIEDQVAQFNVIIANKADIDQLEAAYAKIDQLEATDVTISGKLEAVEADIGDLEADNVIINEKLVANEAVIEDLKVTKLDAETADIKYATIDFANIGDAAIENFFAKSGMIDDLVVSSGTITGTLVGVTIKGDLIEGGTVVADKLVIQGEDGLYYKLNTDGETVSSEQTEYNSLSGTVITAKSITAEKVAVDDLVAFDATIGGFHITDDSLYSGVKESIANTTPGVYMNDDGEFSLGDSNNYLKFYKDTADGLWKLDLSAQSIRLASSGSSLDDTLSDIQNQIDNIEVGDVSVGARNLIRNSKTLIFEEYVLSQSVSLSDDGNGTVTINNATLSDDGAGNITINGAQLQSDGSGKITIV